MQAMVAAWDKCRRRWDLADADHLKYKYMQVSFSRLSITFAVNAFCVSIIIACTAVASENSSKSSSNPGIICMSCMLRKL